MKKNLSFLTKLGVSASAVALVGGLAWATEPTPQQPTTESIWTKATKITTKDSILIAGTVGTTTYVLDTLGHVVKLEDVLPSDQKGFAVADGAASEAGEAAYVFKTTSDNGTSIDTLTIGEDLTLAKRSVTRENSWIVTGGNEIKNASNVVRYMYFDASSQSFQTTTSPTAEQKNISYFVKTEVKLPSFVEESLPASTDIFVSSRTDASKFIKAITTQQNGTVQYRYSTCAEIEGTYTVGTTWYDCNDEGKISLNALPENATDAYVKVEIRTAYASGATTPTAALTRVYHVMLMTHTTFGTLPNKVADDGTYKVSVTNASNPADFQYCVKYNYDKTANVWKDSTTYTNVPQNGIVNVISALGTSAAGQIGKTVWLKVKSSKIGHEGKTLAYADSTCITLTPNQDASTLFGTIKANPAENAKLKVNDEVELSYELSSVVSATPAYEVVNGKGNNPTLTLHYGANQTKDVTATWNGTYKKYTFNVPSELADKDGTSAVAFKVEVPAGLFKAKNNDANNVNVFDNPATEVYYSATFANKTWTIEPSSQRLSADQSEYEVEFNIHPNYLPDAETSFFTDGVVKVSDSQGNAIGTNGASVTKKSGNTYTVKFTSAVVDQYFTDKMTGDYMVTFEPGALRTNDDKSLQKNSNRIVGYISFYETVQLSEPKFVNNTVNDTICAGGHRTSVNFTITGKGHRSDNDYTANICLKANAKAVISCGTNSYDATVSKVEGKNGEFSIQLPSAVWENQAQYTISIPDNIFEVQQGNNKVQTYFNYNNTNTATASSKTPILNVWSHVNFTFSPSYYNLKDGKLTFTVSGEPKQGHNLATNGEWAETDDHLKLVNARKDSTANRAGVNYYIKVKVDGVEKDARWVIENGDTTTTADTDYNGVTGVIKPRESYTFEIPMDGDLTKDEYKVEVLPNQFKGNLDTYAGEEKRCSYRIDYVLCNKNYELDTDARELEFWVYGKKSNGTFLAANTITYIGKTGTEVHVEKSIGLNTGSSQIFPVVSATKDTLIKVGETDVHAVKFTVKWDEALEGNCQLNIPEGTLSANYNDNLYKLFANVQVMNAIDITVPKDIYVQEGSTTVPVYVTGFDKIDSIDATPSVAYINDIVKFNGTDKQVKKETTTDTISVGKVDNGDYTLVIPAGHIRANYTVNKKDLTTNVHFVKAEIVLNDTTFNEYKVSEESQVPSNIGLKLSAKINDQIVDTFAVERTADDWKTAFVTGNVNATDLQAGEAKSDLSGCASIISAIENNISNVAKDSVVVKCTEQLTHANNAINIVTIGKNLFTLPDVWGYVQNDSITNHIYITREFDFVNNVPGKTTQNDDLPTKADENVTINYTQNFVANTEGTYNREPISLPFNVPMSALKDKVEKVEKINFIYTDGSNETEYLYLLELGENDTLHANRPYIIYPKSGELKFTQDSVTLKQAEETTTFCASTTKYVTFYNTFNSDSSINNGWYHTPAYQPNKAQIYMGGGSFYAYTPKKTDKKDVTFNPLKIWRWYGISEDKGIKYVKVVGEDDFDVTGIQNINDDLSNGAPVYNVAGQKINGAKRGLNIVNGKKYVVK